MITIPTLTMPWPHFFVLADLHVLFYLWFQTCSFFSFLFLAEISTFAAMRWLLHRKASTPGSVFIRCLTECDLFVVEIPSEAQSCPDSPSGPLNTKGLILGRGMVDIACCVTFCYYSWTFPVRRGFLQKAINCDRQDTVSVFCGRLLTQSLLHNFYSCPSKLGVLRKMAALWRDVVATVACQTVIDSIHKAGVWLIFLALGPRSYLIHYLCSRIL